MENILKLILIGAGVILTCVVVGVGFYISSESKNTSNSGINQISDIQSENIDVINLYDERSVSGAELKKIIKKHKEDELFILVKTKACTSLQGVYYNYSYSTGTLVSSGTYDEQLAARENLINDNGTFMCKVKKDGLNVVSGLEFIQH